MKKHFLMALILSLVVTSVNAHQSNQSQEVDSHEHKTIIIPEGQPVPTVDLIVYEDSVKGWNLEIKLDNFDFAPETVNQENQPNQGHAHLYVNGEKITRIYGNWYYLPSLSPGTNEIRVSLNTNQHEDLVYQGQVIEDIEIIEVK